MTEPGAAAFMTRTIIALILAVAALLCFTYLYAHRVLNPLPTGTTIDRIVIEKSARTLSIFANSKKLKTYRVALGRNPVGAKQQQGDKKTPEGIYKIDSRNAQSKLSRRAACLLSIRRGQGARGSAGRFSWIRHHDSWDSKRARLARRIPPFE